MYNADQNLRDSNGNTPLGLAAARGNLSTLTTLILHNATIDGRNNKGCTPLAIATSRGHIKIIQELHQKGASIHAQTDNGDTPLHIATQQGYREIVMFLLSIGAKSNITNKQGKTVLTMAAACGHLEIIKTLIEHEINTPENIAVAIKQAKKHWQNSVVYYLEKHKRQVEKEFSMAAQIQLAVQNIAKKNQKRNNELMQKARAGKIRYTDQYVPSDCSNKPKLNPATVRPSDLKKYIKELLTCQQHEQQEASRLEQKIKATREADKDRQKQENENNECCICFGSNTKPIPCKNCKKGSSRICPTCLGKLNTKCPTCNMETLDKTMFNRQK